MADLIATSVSMEFGARTLFSDVSVTLEPGDRVALVGPNGAGKTTLLRLLAGQLSATSGEINVPPHIVVSLHDQRPERSTQTLYEYAAPTRMQAFEAKLRDLEQQMAAGSEAVLDEYASVRTQYDAAGGEAWHANLAAILRGLGFPETQLQQSLESLSGGELTRAALARTLAAQPDVLLLDEPTNHLDLEAIDWLQGFLQAMPGAVVVVSHDRWFIETIGTSVIEIAGGRARRFGGGFIEYRAQQALEAITSQREVERWHTEIARLQHFVDRFQYGTRSRQAQSRMKAMDKLREQAPQNADLRKRKAISFTLPKPERSGATALDVRAMTLGFPASSRTGGVLRQLIDDTSLIVDRGEKVAILGRNGSGKSTFLEAVASACIPLHKRPSAWMSGEIKVGYATTARYLSQHDSELDDNLSMAANMMADAPKLSRREALSLLGLFGFSGRDADRLVGALSGGERRRLLLATALTGSANLLLLDEPTNHLDIESREALEAALAEFEGTVLLISHDRALVEGVATRTLELRDHTLAPPARPVNPPVSEPAHNARSTHRTRRGSGTKSGSESTSASGSKTRTRTRKGGGAKNGQDTSASPRRRSRKRVSMRRPATIERAIEDVEQQLAIVRQAMLDPEVYTSAERSSETLTKHDQLERTANSLYDELTASSEHFGA